MIYTQTRNWLFLLVLLLKVVVVVLSREVQESKSEVRVISESRELLKVMDQLIRLRLRLRLRNSTSCDAQEHQDTEFHLVYVYSSTDSRQVKTLESVSTGFARDCVELAQTCHLEYSDDDYDDDDKGDKEDREECRNRLLFYGVDINKQGNTRFLETLRIMRADCFYVYRTTTPSGPPSRSGEFVESFTLEHITDSFFDLLLRHLVQSSDPLVSKIHCWQDNVYHSGNTTVRVYNDVHDPLTLASLITGKTKSSGGGTGGTGVTGILFSTPWIDTRLEPLFCQGENTVFDRVFQKMASVSRGQGEQNAEMDWISLNGNTNDFFYYTLLNKHHISQYPAVLLTWHDSNKTQTIDFNRLCTRILQKHGETVLRGKLSATDVHHIEQELAQMFQHCVLQTPSGQANCSWFFE